MSGYNLPDDCPWPSDLDYYDSQGLYDPEPDDEEELLEEDDLDDDYEPPHPFGCVCADCSGAELTSDND